MGSSNVRARDVDRDLAVDFVEAAWVDGQLTREEYDVRVDRLLRATTIFQLEKEVSDLQGPDGARWHPAPRQGWSGGSRPVSPVPVPEARGVTPVTRMSRPVAVGVAALILAPFVAMVIAISGPESEPAERTSRSSTVEERDASPAAWEADYDAMVSELASERKSVVFEAELSVDEALLVLPQDAVTDAAWRLVWDGETFSDPVATTSGASRLNLAMLDGAVVRSAVELLTEKVGGEAADGIKVYLQVEQENERRLCLRAEAPAADGTTAVVRFDCQGRNVE